MTIESTRAPEGAKTAATSAHRSAAKPGQAGAGAGKVGEGFAGLMSLLSAVDPADGSTDAALPATDGTQALDGSVGSSDKNVPLALDDQGQIAINFIPTTVPVTAALTSPEASLATAEVVSKASPLTVSSVPSEAPVAAPSTGGVAAVLQAAGNAPANLLGDKLRASDKVDATSSVNPSTTRAPGHDVLPEVTSLLGNRPAPSSSTISQAQADLREVKTALLTPAPATAADSSRIAAAMAGLSGVQNLPERQEAKPHSAQSGHGLEGMFGSALADKLGISPTYEVAPTTAVVADTQVAETVSYWAAHGVQSAKLTLDGLGNEPVEVRISVEGDQAQVDFRSNLPEVRQALENASAQLKSMLSGDGLQLASMTVGTSGRGQTQGDGRQSQTAPRQTKLVSVEPERATTVRAVNPAVGQALDLYV